MNNSEKIQLGKKYYINTRSGEPVIVIYKTETKLILLRESSDFILANNYIVEGNILFWGYGEYYQNSELFDITI